MPEKEFVVKNPTKTEKSDRNRKNPNKTGKIRQNKTKHDNSEGNPLELLKRFLVNASGGAGSAEMEEEEEGLEALRWRRRRRSWKR